MSCCTAARRAACVGSSRCYPSRMAKAKPLPLPYKRKRRTMLKLLERKAKQQYATAA